mgnify:FL=1
MSPRGFTERSTQRESGAIAVEFALIAPLLLLLIVVIIDFGRYFFVQISLNSASHEAARIGSLIEVSGVEMQTLARATAPGAAGLATHGQTSSNITVKACASTTVCTATTLPVGKLCDINVQRDIVYVTVQTTFDWLTPILSGTSPTLTAKAAMLCSI